MPDTPNIPPEDGQISGSDSPVPEPVSSPGEQQTQALPQSDSIPGLNRRPELITSLMIEGSAGPNWYGANRKSNRFYILNVGKVIGDLNIEHTKTDPLFERAVKEIETNTKWADDYPFTFGSSKAQIYPDKRNGAKLYGHAATIIVALEIAASESPRDLNVYDYLRILPAQSFVDRFNMDRLTALRVHYKTLSDADRVEAFGNASSGKSFDEVVLEELGQGFSDRLLEQLASGYTVTKFVADKLLGYVNSRFPEALHVGPVRTCGEDVISKGLGRKNAAPSLRVPKMREPKDIEPIS